MGTGPEALGLMVVRREDGEIDRKRGGLAWLGLLKETRAKESGARTVGNERKRYGTKERRHLPSRRDPGKWQW